MPLCTSKLPPLVLVANGPRLPMRVRLPDVVARLRGTDPSVVGWGLVDTGATSTCISTRIVADLGLKPVGTVQCGGVGGAAEHRLFRVSVEFEGSQPTIRVPNAEVIEADIGNQGLDLLVGRDILASSRFSYDGPTGTWELEIPSPSLAPPAPPAPAPAPPTHGPGLGVDRNKAKAQRKAQKAARKKNRGK
jgi:predicted aspartyl protease